MMTSEEFDAALSQAIARRGRRTAAPAAAPVAAASTPNLNAMKINAIVAQGMIEAAAIARRPGARAHCTEIGATAVASNFEVLAARRRLADAGDHKALFSLGMCYIFEKFGAAAGHGTDKIASYDAVRRSCALGRIPKLHGIEVA